MNNVITQIYYISTGKKNAMYTLRVQRAGGLVGVCYDSYICNLAATPELAEEKAMEHFAALFDRIGETDNFKMVLDCNADLNINHRRGKLSARDTRNLEALEEGLLPFGKHAGKRIEDAPDSYILFFADKAKEEQDVVMTALCAICSGVALERGLIAKRDAARAERKELDSKSNFIGTIKERREFTGLVMMAYEKGFMHEGKFHVEYAINKIRCGDDIVVYIGGKALGVVGETISFKATIKEHSLYEGIKSTKVNRPA